MPMYEYRCNKCGAVYEKLRRAQDADRDLECPDCGAEDVKRLISGFASWGGGGGSCGSSSGGGFT